MPSLKKGTFLFFLPVNYRKIETSLFSQDYQATKPYLEAAVMISDGIKSVLPELIDLLYPMNRLQEAKTWIAMAKEEGIVPARACFWTQ